MDWDMVLSSWVWTVYAEEEVRDLLSTPVALSQDPRPRWQFRLELAPVWMTTLETAISLLRHYLNTTHLI